MPSGLDPQLHLATQQASCESVAAENALALVEQMGVSLSVSIGGGGEAVIATTFDGLTREATLPPGSQVRVVVDPSVTAAITGEAIAEPLLAVTEPAGQTGISRLWHRPKGVATAKAIAPQRGAVAQSTEVAKVDAIVNAQCGESMGVQTIHFPENGPCPDLSFRDENGAFLVRRYPDGRLEWLSPKARRLTRTPLNSELRKQGATGQAISELTDQVTSSPPLLVIREAPSLGTEDYVEKVLASSKITVRSWLTDRYQETCVQLAAKLERGIPWSAIQRRLPAERRGDLSDGTLAIAAAVQVEKEKREALKEIGLARLGGPTFDQFAQMCLPEARSGIDSLTGPNLTARLRAYLPTSDKRTRNRLQATIEGQREELAWEIAKEQAQEALAAIALEGITREELDATAVRNGQLHESVERAVIAERDVRVIADDGERIPSSVFFEEAEGGVSPLSIDEWCALPTRAILVPSGRPERGSTGLAEFLWEGILYSAQVCDRNGQAVGLSPERRQRYINDLVFAIENNMPVSASQYMPLVAIGNPIKRNTQSPALAEIDVLRRMAEISQAVELFYPPGLQWHIGNEAPAFQGPGFNLPGTYVSNFHTECAELARKIDPEGRRLTLFNEADALWGNSERAAQWRVFEAAKDAELRNAYSNPAHPSHRDIVGYINTYIYPMSTCTDPYKFVAAQGLSVAEIAEVYAVIKSENQSVIRGVGALAEGSMAPATLSIQQRTFLVDLKAWALDLTFKYRVAMESRDVLPAFEEFIPPHTLAFTMVTKRDKAVLYPNSGRGAFFPAHGEPVLLRSQNNTQRTVVTVRPWWQIVSQAESYTPVYTPGRQEPLYFEVAAPRA